MNAASGKAILAVVRTKSLLMLLYSMVTLPLSVSVCVCQCVIRKWGAVGVRAVSCWWEWDKNLFPLPKPLALSEASVFFYEATHTQKRTHTHTLTKVCSENRKKVGARKANSTGHRHFGPQTHTDTQTHTHTYARLYTATFLSYL